MKFFFPDSQDLVDPSFDFETETRDSERVRQRDDQYAHEVFGHAPYDGLLVSRGIVEGTGSGGRFSVAQRQRLYREGGRSFFRLVNTGLTLMADCGAFSYVNEEVPPFSVGEVLEFYKLLGCDYGISVDHVILAYRPDWDTGLFGIGGAAPEAIRRRQKITLDLAQLFLDARARCGLAFEPIGVAQGWNPASYRHSFESLQEMGFEYIALGGLVPLKTREILEILEACSPRRHKNVRVHLLGVTRPETVPTFAGFGVVSFDSTSPLRRAFKDSKDNYYTLDRSYSAVARVPQVEANPKLLRAIQAGQVSQESARHLETQCLKALREWNSGRVALAEVLKWLEEYEVLVDPKRAHMAAYREVLESTPWRTCPCEVCRELGYHVILFRGAERNRRRGFHNVWMTRQRLDSVLGRTDAQDSTLHRSTVVSTS